MVARVKRRGAVAAVATVALACAAAPAQAAKSCPEPRVGLAASHPRRGRHGRRQAPGRDRLRLDGGLVRGARLPPRLPRPRGPGSAANDNQTYESYSMSKSLTSLVFGRAMSLGYVSPDDVVGSLVVEADAPQARSPCATCSR